MNEKNKYYSTLLRSTETSLALTRKDIDAKRLEIVDVRRALLVPVAALPIFSPKEPTLNNESDKFGSSDATISTSKICDHNATEKLLPVFEEKKGGQIDAKCSIPLDILESRLFISTCSSINKIMPLGPQDIGDNCSIVMDDTEKKYACDLRRCSGEEESDNTQANIDADEKQVISMTSPELKKRLGSAKTTNDACFTSIIEASVSSENATNNVNLKRRLGKGKIAKVSSKIMQFL